MIGDDPGSAGPGLAWDDNLALGEKTARLTRAVWPRFLCEESDLPEPELSFEMDAEAMASRFPNWGIRRVADHQLVAHLSAVAIAADFSRDTLPNAGWRFAIEAAAASETPNCLCLLAANVDPTFAGRGLASELLARAKAATRARGFDWLIAPVRPSLKSEHPRMPMTDYLLLRNLRGEIHDPWLRAHARAGGEILNVCPDSNLVRASLARWRDWTGLDLSTSGEMLIPNGLVPLAIDVASGTAIYREPGVWVRYRV